MPEHADSEAAETVAAVRAVMSRMPADEQIVFSLRYMGAMEISEVASACGVSERTTKRRLAGAESRFKALAAEVPELQARMAVSGKWRLR
jgi:DNA-directed RNA polymerase specialized sigma24 family protein